MKPGGSLIRGSPVRVASGPDERGMCWHYQTVQVREARPEGATRVNQCLTLRNSEAGSNLVDMGRCAARGDADADGDVAVAWSTPKPSSSSGGEATVKVCGVVVAMLPE